MVVGGAAISGFISYVLSDLVAALFVGGVTLVAGAIGLVLGVTMARRWFFVIGAITVAAGVAGGILSLAIGEFALGGVVLGLMVFATFELRRLWRRFGRHFANPS